ncbi:STAS domain-containing protein [Sediminibacter sp. Hel_I_10]|uniref:STAS domain-containing protein n=1 Tax=Sediminibacter sp. Hel_I_10 TaxID=1392490 RepID=UPI00047C7384|nr:STAS domain-containing protein [Sediminibacter sp. Hel_I_10]
MALKITRNENTFTLEGQINACTASNFKTHFMLMLNSMRDITIDISKVTEIDSNGMHAIKSVYNNATSWHKPFYIIGNGCKEIFQDIRPNYAA